MHDSASAVTASQGAAAVNQIGIKISLSLLLIVLSIYTLALLFVPPIQTPPPTLHLSTTAVQQGASGGKIIGIDLTPTSDEIAFYNNAILFKHLYTIKQAAYTLYIIQPQSNRSIIHDPMYCLLGAGWSLVEQVAYPLPKGEAKAVTIASTMNRTSSILYWFSDGIDQWTSIYQFWLKFMLWRLSFGYMGNKPYYIFLQTPGQNPHWEFIEQEFPQLFSL